MYATKADLASHMGITADQLPATIDNDLLIASEIIDAYTLNRIDPVKHAEVAKRAQILQYEYNRDLGVDLTGSPSSFSAGGFSAQFDGGMAELAPRARRILFTSGLLYRGVRSK